MNQFSSVQSLSLVRLLATPWTTAHQVSLSISNSRSLHKPTSIEPVMPSNHLFLRRPLLLLPSIFPSIRVSSSESALRLRWPKDWSFSISPSNYTPTRNKMSYGLLCWLSGKDSDCQSSRCGFDSWSGKDPTCHKATKSACPNLGACLWSLATATTEAQEPEGPGSTTREAPTMRSLPTGLETSHHLPQLETSLSSDADAAQPPIKK